MISPRIAIIGAGPAGLTLARLLARASIVPKVFERDPYSDYRPQGGTLDLHEKSGQQAIRDAGLWDDFRKHARYDGQESKLLLKTGKIIFQTEGSKEGDEGTKPEIDRTALRNLLLGSLSPDVVEWGHALQSVEPAGENRYNLHFKDGKVNSGYDLVVGADGTWSRVRPLLSSTQAYYSGCTFLSSDIPCPEGPRYHGINRLVGRGSAYAVSDRKGIFGQRHSDNSIRTYVSFVVEDSQWADHFRKLDPAESRAAILKHFEDWDSTILDLVRLSEGPFTSRPLYMLPVGFKWDARPGVTLVGDAAHVMTPYAGEGVNIAMSDSLELAKAIIAGVKEGNLHGKVRESELQMFPKAEKSARRTENNMRLVFWADDIETAMMSFSH